MIEETENINLIKPKEKHYRLELLTPDCFKYREKRQPDGTLKIYKIPALKRFFAIRTRSKCNSFLKANDCIRIQDRYSTFYLPSLEIAKNFGYYLDGLKEILEDELKKELEKNKKQGDSKKEEELNKKINYLNKHWQKNKPRFNVIEALPIKVV
jgi:hypothetical protein